MKSLLLMILLFTSSSYAMSDIDRAILFGANAASMGSFIAQMEGEIENIKLNYEKQTAEFKATLENDHQAYLKEMLTAQLSYLQTQKGTYEQLRQAIHQRNEGFKQIVELSSKLHKGLLEQEDVITQLKRLNESFPGIEKDWIDLLAESVGESGSKTLNSAQYETVLMAAIRLYAESDALEKDINEQISFLSTKASSVEVHLKELP